MGVGEEHIIPSRWLKGKMTHKLPCVAVETFLVVGKGSQSPHICLA